MYYNPANGLLNLHALRDIEANEELTSFACPCKCRCCHAVDGANRASEYRRLTLKILRAELTAHHRAAEDGAPTMDAVRQAIAVSRRLVEMLEQEGCSGSRWRSAWRSSRVFTRSSEMRTARGDSIASR
ncbi:hypothetical protein PG996_002608 [Apiospora saccharicola]|uniref:Uncharacterized protein n=1 Tax=Apiospora saccharicola TaxID=335842 RepID=A0ABR1WLD3_9PEZI